MQYEMENFSRSNECPGTDWGIRKVAKITHFVFYFISQLKNIKTCHKVRLKAEILYFSKISNYLSHLLNLLSNTQLKSFQHMVNFLKYTSKFMMNSG